MVTTADHADKFLVSRGVTARVYWDEVSPQVKASDTVVPLLTGCQRTGLRIPGRK